MSFLLNKVASLFATLVVVGIVLFCSSAAQAHANHDAPAVQVSVETDAAGEASVGTEAGTQAIAAVGADGSTEHRGAGTSCCGNGMSNCMTAAVISPLWALPGVRPAGHGRPLEPNAIRGAVVDGPVRPPRALV
ncbi:hypothetical protein NS365_01345 [Aureimonas ureilytica]|uniref:Uncharacterized protein n=1 Tax=Aureimonas ureilytica TaxID=401562 RepID=A0A175RWY5_9HYPH|nr:hypothetical protein [Aureimonas ureilytica]KTR08305.1 hypothetical protein NS365_01345 [Aureimonas ureilytica]